MENVLKEISLILKIQLDKIEFLNNTKYYEISQKRTDNIKSYTFASILNYLENPIGEIDNLYFGSEIHALNFQKLKKIGITHILNIANESFNFYENDFIYKNFDLKDEENEILPIYDSLKFINNCLENKGKILIHRIEGKSRSGAIVIAYIMFKYNISYKEALKITMKQRYISPNPGFIKQLKIYFI